MAPGRRTIAQRPRLELLSRDLGPLARAFGYAGEAAARRFVDGLARNWQGSAPADMVLVLRPGPPPALGALAAFDSPGVAVVQAVRGRLERLQDRLRYVSYAQAEADCEVLAGRLTDLYGPQRLASFHCVALPKGGLIVLGMLSYLLGLEPRQVEVPPPPGAPLLVVDDAAFSGSRFHKFVSRCDASAIVFATLYSHPALRAAIEAEEPQTNCVSARDLADHVPEPVERDEVGYAEAWQQRLAEHRYWIGDTDVPCFAWSEPDWSYWNPVAERVEDGWHVAPPDRCLERRREGSNPPIPVQIQPQGKGPLLPTPRVLFGRYEDQIVIGHMDTGAGFGLQGVAADMWRAILEHGDLDQARTALLELYDVDAATVSRDLEAFTKELIARDLLE